VVQCDGQNISIDGSLSMGKDAKIEKADEIQDVVNFKENKKNETVGKVVSLQCMETSKCPVC
jgi:hypothetical protein